MAIGIIHRVQAVSVPHLSGWRGTVTFQEEKVKNLLPLAVNRGDLRRLNYNKIVFGWGSTPNPARESMTLSQTPESGEEGILPPYSLTPSHLGTHSPSELVPPLFTPSYTPEYCYLELKAWGQGLVVQGLGREQGLVNWSYRILDS